MNIEELKHPSKALRYELLEVIDPEAAKIIKKAYPKSCLYFSDKAWRNVTCEFGVSSVDTYILKPDYQPEPEYVDLEIGLDDGFYGAWSDKGILLPTAFTHLHCLESLPGFRCFWQDDDDNYKDTAEISRSIVVCVIEDGMKVYARFRTKKQE